MKEPKTAADYAAHEAATSPDTQPVRIIAGEFYGPDDDVPTLAEAERDE